MKKIIHVINAKYLNLDLSFFVKNTPYTLLPYGISLVVTFLTTYILANFVSEHTIGVYRYVFSWYGILSIFALGGAASAITISIAQGHNSLRQALRYKALFSGIAFFITTFIASYYLYKENTEIALSFFALALSIPAMELVSVFASYFQGKEDFKRLALLSIISKVTILICTLGAVYFFPTSYFLILSSLLFVAVAQGVFVYSIRKEVTVSLKKEEDPNLLSTSLHFSSMSILYTLGAQADKIILFTFFGSGALASYWIATTIPLEIQRFISQFTSIYFPKLVRQNKTSLPEYKQFVNKFLKIICIIFLILITIAILYTFFAPLLFAILFPNYTNSVLMSQLFLYTIIFTPFLFIWQYFLAQKDTKIMYFYHTCDPLLQILFYFIFIQWFGIFGIIYAIFTKNIIMSLFAVVLLLRKKLFWTNNQF